MAQLPKYILASGEIFDPTDAAQAERMANLGLPEASPEAIRHDNLKQQYSGWAWGIEAGALGVANAVLPGATGAAVHALSAISPEMGQTTSDFIEGVEAAHPYAKGAGLVGGMLTPGGIAGKAAGALAKAGAGAVTTGATVAGATGLAMTYDQRATEHIQTPEGAEKVAAIYAGAGLLSALTGGLVSFAGTKIAAGALGKAGAQMEASASAKIAAKTPINNPGVQEALAKTGSQDAVAELAEKHSLDLSSPKQLKGQLKEILTKSGAQMNEAKAVSSEPMFYREHMKFAKEWGATLADENPVLKPLRDAVEYTKGMTVEQMHRLRQKADGLINWNDPSSAYSQKLLRARNLADEYITKVFEANEANSDLAAGQLDRWRSANADYSAALKLQDALKQSQATGKSWVGAAGRMLSSYGKGHAIFNAFGANPVGVAQGGAMYAGGKAITGLAEGNVIPATVQGLGKVMQTFDDAVVSRAVGLLEGKVVAGQTAPFAAQALGLGDYHTVAAMVQNASDNPTYTVPQMAQSMEEAGVPGQCVDAAIGPNIRALQYLNSSRPQSPWAGQTVAPTPWQPSTGEKAAFLEKVNTCLDPLGALGSLTPQKAETLRAVYPELTSKLTTIITQEAATRPDMPRKARQKAAMLTGLPADPLDTPQAQASLLLNSMSMQQPAQGPARPSGGGGNTISAGQTRLNRMSQQ